MAIQEVGNNDNMYLTIIGGKLVQKVDESNAKAVRRDYELKDGTKGTKWEIAYKNLSGNINSIEFKDSDYGKNLILELLDGSESYVISMSTGSRYFTDFAKKLPNIKLDTPIEFNPYDFISREGKQLRGVSILQDSNKVASAYWDGKKTLKGAPETTPQERKEYDSDDWKSFFIKEKKFLIKEVEKVSKTVIKKVVDTKEDQAFIDEAKEIF